MSSRRSPHTSLSLFGERFARADVDLGLAAAFGDSEPMPCQTRLNLYATLFALLGFVILAFTHA